MGSPLKLTMNSSDKLHGSAWQYVGVGAVCLTVGMGIGRFSYTSILPLMLGAQVLTLHEASSLASLNYGGYLLGAVICTFIPEDWSSSRLVRYGLLLTILTTGAMIIPSETRWFVLRFTAGVVTAIVLVHSVKWSLHALSLIEKTSMGSLIFVGVGLGIALSGVATTAMINAHWQWQAAWASSAIVSMILTAMIWKFISYTPFNQQVSIQGEYVSSNDTSNSDITGLFLDKESALYTLAYALAGLGCIITATYLPMIARSTLSHSIWLDLFWPIYGIASALGSYAVTRIHGVYHLRTMLIACYVLQAAGIAITIFLPTVTGFVAGSILAGLPFTATNYLAMEEARLMRPHQSARFIGLLTAAFAVGQIIGPTVVQFVLNHNSDVRQSFDISLEIACMALLTGAGIYLLLRTKFFLSDKFKQF